MIKNTKHFPSWRATGFTLVELMVAMTAGLILIAALMLIYGAATRTDRTIKKTGDLIENARYGMFSFADDIRHAGFYGSYSLPGMPPSSLPDPCSVDAGEVRQSLPIAIQAYSGGTNPPVSCISANDYLKDSDVVVIRRARTVPVASATDLVNGALYIQANGVAIDVQKAKTQNFDIMLHNAKAEPTTLFRKQVLPTDPPPAELRRAEVRIYFVSKCSNDSCGTSGGDGIPTLKRLELDADTAGNTVFRVVPVASGVERMRVDFGVDDTPATVDEKTGSTGDGKPDGKFRRPGGTGLDSPGAWAQVVSANIFFVVRELEPTTGYVDAKTYDVGEAEPSGYKPASAEGAFRRHAFQSRIWIVNRGGRRET